MAARSVVDRETVNDVCRNLNKYINWRDIGASIVSTAYIMALDEDVIRNIMVALLEESDLEVPAGHVVEDLRAYRQIVAVWRAVCERDVDVLEMLDAEVQRRRTNRTNEGVYGPAAARQDWLARGPEGRTPLSRDVDGPVGPVGPDRLDGLDRTDGEMLSQMHSHLLSVTSAKLHDGAQWSTTLAEDRLRIIRSHAPIRKGEDLTSYEEVKKREAKWTAQQDLWCEFENVWNEFRRFFHSVKQSIRDFSRGVGYKQIYGSFFTNKKTDFGKIYKTGEELLKQWNYNPISRKSRPEIMVLPCLRALFRFVKFLKWKDKTRFEGLDDAWRDIYHKRNLKFKEQWTLVLRHMIDFVQLEYPDEALLKRYLNSIFEKHDWPNVLAKVAAAEMEVATERSAAARRDVVTNKTRQQRRRPPARLTSELDSPHALERMRGLLCEI